MHLASQVCFRGATPSAIIPPVRHTRLVEALTILKLALSKRIAFLTIGRTGTSVTVCRSDEQGMKKWKPRDDGGTNLALGQFVLELIQLGTQPLDLLGHFRKAAEVGLQALSLIEGTCR